jgi:hypothetical protein
MSLNDSINGETARRHSVRELRVYEHYIAVLGLTPLVVEHGQLVEEPIINFWDQMNVGMQRYMVDFSK